MRYISNDSESSQKVSLLLHNAKTDDSGCYPTEKSPDTAVCVSLNTISYSGYGNSKVIQEGTRFGMSAQEARDLANTLWGLAEMAERMELKK